MNSIQKRHHVYNYIDSYNTKQEAQKVLTQVTKIERMVLQERSPENRLKKDPRLGARDEKVKVLGMWWNVRNDELKYSVNEEKLGHKILECDEPPTRYS